MATSKKTEEAPAATSSQGKAIVLDVNGKQEKRVDYIRRRYYDEGAERGEIRKEVIELQGKDVAYQIIFAATKEKREDRAARLEAEKKEAAASK